MLPVVAGTEGTHYGVKQVERHWDEVYRTRSPETLSWYTPHLASLELIRSVSRDAAIIDVGGGSSTLIEDLLDEGFADVTVLDVSPAALEMSRQRLADRATQVAWIRADVTVLASLPKMYDVWHDRAVFHFLTEDAERHAYARLLRQSLKPGGRAIIQTFALDGPEMCSGLPVVRYDAGKLKDALGEPLELRSARNLIHVTPAGREQAFILCEFVRTLCG